MQPEAFERGLVDMIRQRGDLRCVEAGPPTLSIYRTLVLGRFESAIEASLPRTAARLGARLREQVATFVAERASRSHYVRDIAAEFLGWAAPRWRADLSTPRYLVDLASYELLQIDVCAAEDDAPHPSAPIGLESILLFRRGARAAAYGFAVHRLADDADDRIAPRAEHVRLLAYRDDADQFRLLELERPAAALIDLLMRGRPLGLAAREACHATEEPISDQVLARQSLLLQELDDRGIIAARA